VYPPIHQIETRFASGFEERERLEDGVDALQASIEFAARRACGEVTGDKQCIGAREFAVAMSREPRATS
jgi:hypothetical protein